MKDKNIKFEHIQLKQIKDIFKNLRNNKSTGLDNISNEMIK